MYYAEVKTKDNTQGCIAIDEDQVNIVKDCCNYIEENNLSPDDLAETKIVDRETGETVGEIQFERG